jgi:dTDP-4-dehydrorhamnose reductase
MVKKVVVIGSNGLLGQTLVNKLIHDSNYQLYTMASGKNRNSDAMDLRYYSIDLEDFKTIKIQLNLIEPDFVVNALAMTHVDECEINQEDCKRINTDFVTELAEVCRELKTHLIHISTDFIFDGKEGIYREEDVPNPLNYYGLSKLWSEQAIIDSGAVYSILRTILVYGKVANMKRSNIVIWIKESLEKGNSINLVEDQFRMPTFVGSLADACILTMKNEAVGIFHISDKDYFSIAELGFAIASYFNLPQDLIVPIPSNKLNQAAKRPAKTGFLLDKAVEKLQFKPLTLIEGLDQMFK